MNVRGFPEGRTPVLAPILILGVGVLFWALPVRLTLAEAVPSPSGAKKVETVQGYGCYFYGDDETPAKAKKAARILAQEQAVRHHQVYIKSQSRIKNLILDEDIIQATSAAILHHIVILKEEKKTQEICVSLSAEINPVSMEELINQQITAKELADDAETLFVPQQPAFGLRVWTNKADGRFLEGDGLIIFVESERDAYVKIDYFQADGTVVHLVPNVFNRRTFIQAGRRYAFGDGEGAEMFVVSPPFGAETIKVIASTRPLRGSLPQPKQSLSDSRTYLRDMRTSLRGISIVSPASASVRLRTESKVVKAYKEERPTQ